MAGFIPKSTDGSLTSGMIFSKWKRIQEKVEDSSYDVTRAEKAGGIDPPAFNYDFEIASRIDKS